MSKWFYIVPIVVILFVLAIILFTGTCDKKPDTSTTKIETSMTKTTTTEIETTLTPSADTADTVK